MLTENQVALIAAIGRMFYVLAFLAGEGRPLRAREIASRLRTEYETVRNYLEELAVLRVAAKTGRGWTTTGAGRKLVLQIAGLPAVWVSENAENPRFTPRKTRKNRADTEIPYFSPFIIVNSESVFKSKEEEELTITTAESAEEPRFLDQKRGSTAFQASAGEIEQVSGGAESQLSSPEAKTASGEGRGVRRDPAETARLEGLSQALREAGIKPNHRTRPLFTSDFLTGDHVAGYASRLRGYYGSGYRTNILIGVLESLRPGDSPPERGRSLADILCPKCFCSPCHCGDEVDGADWEE